MKRTLFCLTLFLILVTTAAAQAPGGIPHAAALGIDYLQSITDSVNQLIDTHGDALIPFAQLELTYIGIFQLGMLVIKRTIVSFHVFYAPDQLVAEAFILLLQIAVIHTALLFYNVPLPGSSISLHQIPTELGRIIAVIFDTHLIKDFMDYVNFTIAEVHKPSSILDVLGCFVYLEVLIQMGFLDLCLFLINAVSFFFVGMLTVLGPPMLPLFLSKHFSKWLFNWIEMMFQYSMLRATSAGMTFLWVGIEMTFFQKSVHGDYSITRFLALTPVMVMLNIGFLYSMFSLPTFTARLYGGVGSMTQSFVDDVKGFIRAAAIAA